MRRGGTLIELLVATTIMLVVGGVFFGIVSVVYGSHDANLSCAYSVTAARSPLDTLADHLRNAQANPSDNKAAIADGQPNEITYYSDASGSTVRYFLSGTDLKRTDALVTTTAFTGIDSISFQYRLLPKYNWGTFSPSAGSTLSASERPKVAQVIIRCQATVNGVVRSYVTTVRLRNSPAKNVL